MPTAAFLRVPIKNRDGSLDWGGRWKGLLGVESVEHCSMYRGPDYYKDGIGAARGRLDIVTGTQEALDAIADKPGVTLLTAQEAQDWCDNCSPKRLEITDLGQAASIPSHVFEEVKQSPHKWSNTDLQAAGIQGIELRSIEARRNRPTIDHEATGRAQRRFDGKGDHPFMSRGGGR